MSAASTDYFKKLSRRWVGQIGSGGVSDGTTQTIPLSSVTNLPTDTGVVFVIDRVDVNGDETPGFEETGYGVVSGSNLVTCTRGVEGTAQAHNAGAVVEILFTAAGWNKVMDGILIGHNQDGTHVLDTDGTLAANSDTKIASQKAIKTYVDAHAGTTDGWTTDSHTWVYASASTFTIAGVDLTAVFTKGTRIKFTQTTVKYGVVVASAFSTNTTVTIAVNTDYTIANAAITSPYYSYQVCPAGYPTIFTYTPAYGGFSSDPSGGTNKFRVDGKICTIYRTISSLGTSNATTFTVSVPITSAAQAPAFPVGITDNSANASSPGFVDVGASTTTATVYKTYGSASSWTNSGTKDVQINGFQYQI